MSVTLPDVSGSQAVVTITIVAAVVTILLWIIRAVVTDGTSILDKFQRATASHEDAVRGVLDARVDYLERRLMEEMAYRAQHDATLAAHRAWDQMASDHSAGVGPIPPLYPCKEAARSASETI